MLVKGIKGGSSSIIVKFYYSSSEDYDLKVKSLLKSVNITITPSFFETTFLNFYNIFKLFITKPI